jgi:hypothetical protein
MEDVGDEGADLLIVNGRVFEGGDPRPIAGLPPGSRDGPPDATAPDTVAVHGGRIAWVGRATVARAWRGRSTEVIDARGGLVAPGFEDAHLHLRMGALSMHQVDLQGADTIDELAVRLRAWRAAHPGVEWLIGRGWHYAAFPGGMPDRALLDSLVPDVPAVLECFDGHTHWLNSAALARAGITAGTPHPARGAIERDPRTGAPTGILKEFAHELLEGVLPRPSEDEVGAAIREAAGLALRHGVTSVQEAWTELEDLHRYARLHREAALGLRLRVALPADPLLWRDGIERGREAWAERLDAYATEVAAAGQGDELGAGIVKVFADGVIESGTAWMRTPYEGQDTKEPGPFGRPNWSPEALSEVTALAVARGWQVEIHAIGDAAIGAALDAHAQATRIAPHPRGRIEHVEWPAPSDVPRFGSSGVIASMQPSHASPEPDRAAGRAERIGARTAWGWPWGSILRSGGVVAFGSDWPVTSFDPFVQLHTAVSRTDAEGRPDGGWVPGERLSVAEALACYTWGSAYAAFAEDRRGTIAPGRDADLAVLDRDPLREGPGAIAGTRVVATIRAGRVVYRAG